MRRNFKHHRSDILFMIRALTPFFISGSCPVPRWAAGVAMHGCSHLGPTLLCAALLHLFLFLCYSHTRMHTLLKLYYPTPFLYQLMHRTRYCFFQTVCGSIDNDYGLVISSYSTFHQENISSRANGVLNNNSGPVCSIQFATAP